MAIQRNILFCNGKGYTIDGTMAHIHQLRINGAFEHDRYMEIIQALTDAQYCTRVPDFITHPDTGVLMETPIWLYHFGVEDDTFNFIYPDDEYDNNSVGTFPVEETMEDDDDTITSEDERHLVANFHQIVEMNDTLNQITIDLTYSSDEED